MTSPNEHRLLRWVPEVTVLVTWSLTVIGAVWATSAERADVRHELREQKSAMIDHEARLRVLEKQTGEIAADVRWIRQTLEKHNP